MTGILIRAYYSEEFLKIMTNKLIYCSFFIFSSTALAWHPVHEEIFASGGSDGAVMFWAVGSDKVHEEKCARKTIN